MFFSKRFCPAPADLLFMVSSLCFFAGSVSFLPKFSAFAAHGVLLFMVGSLLMLAGSTLASIRKP